MLVDSNFVVDPAMVPWVFIGVFVVPFFVVLILAPRHLRAAAWVMAVFSLAYFLFMAIGVASSGFVLEGWGDYIAGYVGGIASAVGLVAAIRTLAVREQSVAAR